jgi:hypothetical protein
VTVPQLRSNLDAFELSLTDVGDELLASMTEDPASYWERRSSLPWR